jgi:hypothetical protein
MNIEMQANAMEMPAGSEGAGRRKRKRGRKMLLRSLSDLDRRTAVYKRVLEVVEAIEADLGGDPPTTVRQIIVGGALLGAMREDLGVRWLAGEDIDRALYATLCNAERRMYETAGLERRAKDVTPSLSEYLARFETKTTSGETSTSGGAPAASRGEVHTASAPLPGKRISGDACEPDEGSE